MLSGNKSIKISYLIGVNDSLNILISGMRSNCPLPSNNRKNFLKTFIYCYYCAHFIASIVPEFQVSGTQKKNIFFCMKKYVKEKWLEVERRNDESQLKERVLQQN